MQLLLSHLSLVLLMGFVMGGAILAFFQIGRSIDRVLRDNFKTVLSASHLQTSLAKQDTAFAMLAYGERAGAAGEYSVAVNDAAAALDEMRGAVTEDEETAVVGSLNVEFLKYRKIADELMQARPRRVAGQRFDRWCGPPFSR